MSYTKCSLVSEIWLSNKVLMKYTCKTNYNKFTFRNSFDFSSVQFLIRLLN